MRLPSVVVLLCALGLGLAGCAPSTEGKSEPHASPSPSSTAESEPSGPARETGLVAPEAVFGGDCNGLFTEAEVSAAVGASLTRDTAAETGADADRIAQLGGIMCWWSSSEGEPFWAVWLAAVPADSVVYSQDPVCEDATWGESVCLLEAVENGVRISGIVNRENSQAASMPAAQAELLALFATKAAAAKPVPTPIPAVGAWLSPAVCEDLVARADFTAVAGLGPNSVGEGAGGRGGYLPAIVTHLHGDDQLPWCAVTGESATVYFFEGGGLRWRGAALAEAVGATPIAVDGIDLVLASERPDGRFTIDVLDGPNWLQFDVAFTKNAGAIATQLVAALDETAID